MTRRSAASRIFGSRVGRRKQQRVDASPLPSCMRAHQTPPRHRSIAKYNDLTILDNDSVAARSVINIIPSACFLPPPPTFPWSFIFPSTLPRTPNAFPPPLSNDPQHLVRISSKNRHRHCFHLQDGARVHASFVPVSQGPSTRPRSFTAHGDHFTRSDAPPHKSKRKLRCSRG